MMLRPVWLKENHVGGLHHLRERIQCARVVIPARWPRCKRIIDLPQIRYSCTRIAFEYTYAPRLLEGLPEAFIGLMPDHAFAGDVGV
jgi:hypothetical protein